MDGDFIVTAAHLATMPNWTGSTGLCHRGARQWCARYGFDWLTLSREGIAASKLIATGDAIALQLVEHARSEVQRGQ